MSMKKYILSLLTIIAIFFTSCSNREYISERASGLEELLNDISCDRYTYTVKDYASDNNQVGITIYYDEQYYKDKIYDLFFIKTKVEEYINSNIDMFSESSCSIICYSQNDVKYDIPIPYIHLSNDHLFSKTNENNSINCMEINSDIYAEQFLNVEADINVLDINFEYTKSFDYAVLSHFTNLTSISIPSKICSDEALIADLIPPNCEVEIIQV